MFLRGAWFFWARFLFQLSVPTVGKPLLTQLPQGRVPPKIVIVITKADLFIHRPKEVVTNDIRYLFHPLFVPGGSWKVVICPVTLGMSLRENPSTGGINPTNVHLPILFAVYETLREQATRLRSEYVGTKNNQSLLQKLLRPQIDPLIVDQYTEAIKEMDRSARGLFRDLSHLAMYYKGREVVWDE